jgi:hypothetical protein
MAASTRSLSAFLSALLSLLDEIPSCFAASSSTAWFSSEGEELEAPIATPPPAAASNAAIPMPILLVRFMRTASQRRLRGR